MSQTYKFISNLHGTSKVGGKQYNMVNVSDGLSEYPAFGNPNNLDFSKYKRGDDIQLNVHFYPRQGKISADVLSIIDTATKPK